MHRDKVLVVGSSAREHALIWRLLQSPQVDRIIVAAPRNDGIMESKSKQPRLERWEFSIMGSKQDFMRLAQRAHKSQVSLAVIGSAIPLANGIVDVFENLGLRCFGPSAQAASIETSKSFAKELMVAAGIPTARYAVFDSLKEVSDFLRKNPWNDGWVVKADGLAGGKGVTVCETLDQGLSAAALQLKVSGKILIEERLRGGEVSWHAICQGKHCVLLDPARDHKTLKEGNQGPNTGGMGTYSPVLEVMEESFSTRVRETIFEPVLTEMLRRDIVFKGVLYAGLMYNETTDQLWVLEFNARFGDPEAQVILPRLEGDLYELLSAAVDGNLKHYPKHLPFKKNYAVYVIAASPGYPSAPKKGLPISGPICERGVDDPNPDYFYSGVTLTGKNQWITSADRVLGALGIGSTLREARNQAYSRIGQVSFPGMQVRQDIAKTAAEVGVHQAEGGKLSMPLPKKSG